MNNLENSLRSIFIHLWIQKIHNSFVGRSKGKEKNPFIIYCSVVIIIFIFNKMIRVEFGHFNLLFAIILPLLACTSRHASMSGVFFACFQKKANPKPTQLFHKVILWCLLNNNWSAPWSGSSDLIHLPLPWQNPSYQAIPSNSQVCF